MRRSTWVKYKLRLMLVVAGGSLCQFGTCDFGEITTTSTTTLDTGELIAILVRGAIITPLDQWLTNAIDEVIESGDE
ncbi:MAG: hypothetical protein IH987_07465 [Planctomycetes bacterium]|nr:hypothetical protein [Planctomycetota bacterium]